MIKCNIARKSIRLICNDILFMLKTIMTLPNRQHKVDIDVDIDIDVITVQKIKNIPPNENY